MSKQVFPKSNSLATNTNRQLQVSLKKKAITSGEFALTNAEIQKLLKSVSDIRTKLLITLAISTGIRRRDIVNIRRKDITTNQITFLEHKKNGIHNVPISNELHNLCLMYIKVSRKSKWLFPSNRVSKNVDNHLHDRQCWNIFNSALDNVGLKRRPFHSLRATCIKQAQRNGWGIEQVMKLTNDTFQTIKLHYDTPTQQEMSDVATQKPII